MKFKRSSGILLHPTSLPGRMGLAILLISIPLDRFSLWSRLRSMAGITLGQLDMQIRRTSVFHLSLVMYS